MWALAARPRRDRRGRSSRAAPTCSSSTTKGFTPLMFAARNGDIDMGKVLIAAGRRRQRRSAPTARTSCRYAIHAAARKTFAHVPARAGRRSERPRSMACPRCMPQPAPVGHVADDWPRRHGVSTGPLTFALGGRRRRDRTGRVSSRRCSPRAPTRTDASPRRDVHGLHRITRRRARSNRTRPAPATCAAPRRSGWRLTAPTAAAVRRRGHGRWHDLRDSGEVLKALLAAGANPHLTTVDGTTPLMVAAGLGRATFQPGTAARPAFADRRRSRQDPARRGRRTSTR